MMLRMTVATIAFLPAALAAQVTGSASARSHTEADARVGKSAVSATAATSVEAELAAARSRQLPERPIRRRAAEGMAKGASEAQIALESRRVRMNMEAVHEAMVSAGRTRPSDEEIERGAHVMERGYTRADIHGVATSAAADRSLVVAFDVLARLSQRGVSTTRALTEVQSRLEARAPDAALTALVSANSGVGVSGQGRAAAVTGNAAAGASAATNTGVAATGAVTGVLKGVIKP